MLLSNKITKPQLRNKFVFIIVFIFYFLFTVMNCGQSLPSNEYIFSPKNRLKFGNYLFSEEDYLRAINEYREYLKTENNDTIRFKYAECFNRIGRYEEAAENYKSLFFNSELSEEAKLAFFKAHFLSRNFSLLRDLTEKEIYFSEKYSKYINRLRFISYLFDSSNKLDNSTLPDTNQFFSAFDDSNYSAIKKFYLLKKYPVYKNQTKAAVLSAIVPGLGKIYVGEISDGITAFVATGLLTFLSINNFNHDHNFRGWLFAGLSALSYAGNIYGSLTSTQIYNAKIKFNFDNEVRLYFEQRNFLLPKIDFLEK